jgi:predicted component of type VI protein secretion system
LFENVIMHPCVSAHSGAPVGDWLHSQRRVVEALIDRLVAEDGDARLIALLDQHAAFLREAGEIAAP